MALRKMIVTDLDGTLLNSEGQVSNRNYETLNKLKDLGHLRVIATGRSLFSTKKILTLDFPFDYLISSTGAGLFDWHNQELLKSYNLNKEEVKETFNLLVEMKMDFIVQKAVPESHKCFYLKFSNYNPDFDKRNEIYKEYIQHIDIKNFTLFESCQFIVILHGYEAIYYYDVIKSKLKNLKVIRTTSPQDHKSLWIEIYSAEVSKARGIDFIATKHNITNDNIMVIGNDYNDLDMLRFAKNSFVVSNAPDDLKKEFINLASHDLDGFSEAVDLFLGK